MQSDTIATTCRTSGPVDVVIIKYGVRKVPVGHQYDLESVSLYMYNDRFFILIKKIQIKLCEHNHHFELWCYYKY